MKNLIALLLLSTSAQSFAATYHFGDCAPLMSAESLASIHAYFAKTDTSPSCLKLNEKEFLAADFWGLHYCSSLHGPMQCALDDESGYSQNFGVEREFMGARNKQYVLFSASMMRRGDVSSQYGVFNLVPKSINPRGYTFYWLTGVGLAVSEGDSCFEGQSTAVTEVPKVEVVSPGTANVALGFTEVVLDCSKSQKTTQQLKYGLVNGKFEAQQGAP